MAKRYSYRLLAIWEQKTEEEKEHDREFLKKVNEKIEKVKERILKTERDWKVHIEGLGWVEKF